jgi:hypothetical protein
MITADPVCADWFNSEARSDIAAKQLIIPVKRKKNKGNKKFKKSCTGRKGWIVCWVLRFYGCKGVDHGGSPVRTRNVL